MGAMLTLLGSAALSPFRLEQRVASLATAVARVSGLTANWLHLVDVVRMPSAEGLESLLRLLGGGAALDPAADPSRELLVGPRTGTQSPGRTQASEIAQQGGLSGVRGRE